MTNTPTNSEPVSRSEAEIRKALEAGPDSALFTHPRDSNKHAENTNFAAACDPQAIRALLAELDALRAAVPSAQQSAQVAPDPMNYKGMFMSAVQALAEIDALLGQPEDGCNDPQMTVSALKDFISGVADMQEQRSADEATGAAWRQDSSLEKWFPITAERLALLERAQVAAPVAPTNETVSAGLPTTTLGAGNDDDEGNSGRTRRLAGEGDASEHRQRRQPDEREREHGGAEDGAGLLRPLASGVAYQGNAEQLGIELAARWVDARREAFMLEHGHQDPDTGAWEYGTGAHANAKQEYEGELAEIAEGIRSLYAGAPPVQGAAPATPGLTDARPDSWLTAPEVQPWSGPMPRADFLRSALRDIAETKSLTATPAQFVRVLQKMACEALTTDAMAEGEQK